MRRAWLCALLGAAACSSRSLPLPISIVGLDDEVLIHPGDGGTDLLFLTSADRNELRVLNLDPNLAPRDFIRAPNPIEPLAIPLLQRPASLAKDIAWDADGNAFHGPYVYARSAAGSEVSVVSAASAALYEYCRVGLSGIVTAVAARGPGAFACPLPDGGAADGGAQSRLFYATWDGAQGHLGEADLAGPGSLARSAIPGSDHMNCVAQDELGDAGTAGAGLPFARHGLVDLPGESITAIAVLPSVVTGTDGLPLITSPDGGPAWPNGAIVVATHSGQSGGRTFLLDPCTLTSRPLAFPAPVRTLLTNDRVVESDPSGNLVPSPIVVDADGGTSLLVEGARVYGVLDEAACANEPACNGMLAVDTITGQVSFDGTMGPDGKFQRMLTLGAGGALVTGLTVSSNAFVFDPAQGSLPLSQLGMMSASNGALYFFNAGTLQPLNGDTSAAAVVSDSTGTPIISLQLTDGGTGVAAQGTGPDPASFAVGEGAAQSETVDVVFEGQIPPLTSLALPGDGGLLLALPAGGPPVFVGDLIQFNGANPACSAAPLLGTVAAVSAAGAQLNAAAPAACADATTFTVRAFGPTTPGQVPLPFEVEGTVSGYIGRTGPGAPPLVFRGTSYFHQFPAAPADGGVAVPGPADQAPALVFQMLPQADPLLVQDDFYSFQLVSNFAPLYLSVDVRVGTGFQLPGQIAFDATLQKAYVAYPAANGVIEFSPSAIAPNQPNYTNLQPYR